MSIEIGMEWFNIVFPALTGLAGVLLAQKYETKRKESEEKRWYMSHVLDRKLESLARLYSSLQDCFLSITVYLNSDPEKFNDYVRKQDSYISSLTNAAVYLNHDEFQVMYDFLLAFIQAKSAIWVNLQTPDGSTFANKQPLPNEVLDHFKETSSKATETLRKHFNPVILKQLSHKYNFNK